MTDQTGCPECKPRPRAPAEVPGSIRVIRPCDGDTILIDWLPQDPIRDRARLMEIDAPERGQVGWNQATAELARLLSLQPPRVVIASPGLDLRCTCNRVLVWVWVGSALVNEQLVRAGLARHYRRFGRTIYTHRLAQAELFARTHRVGLWASGVWPAHPQTTRR